MDLVAGSPCVASVPQMMVDQHEDANISTHGAATKYNSDLKEGYLMEAVNGQNRTAPLQVMQ